MRLITLLFATLLSVAAWGQDLFPDGTPIPAWFSQNTPTDISQLGKHYNLADHGVVTTDSTLVQTEKIQAVIDKAAQNGGGVIIVPKGTILSGALFFKPGTHLHLQEGAVLKGSNDISDYVILSTRIEGETCNYFSAFINADKVDGFTLTGKGAIDGNGERFWKAFWLRRKWNRQCTNKDEQRPRLVYISNSNDVRLEGVTLRNSPFWTTHLYRCNRVKLLGLTIFAPHAPVKAPSSDAVDVDVCRDVLIKNCYMSVNDDAVALKGGKGTWADKDPNNGENRNVIIEDCTYGFCHSALTCGSESIHNYNIILRRTTVSNATRLLWLKMRPDTPQHYEYITVEDIKGDAKSMIYIKPWTQFYNKQEREDMPLSQNNNITMRRIDLKCDVFFNVSASDQYKLNDFTFEDLNIKAKNGECDRTQIENFTWKNVKVSK